ncbi:MAG: hypothetical protein IJU83_04370 [Clostridia bacterium]|nr:hypothetical protein [Clostridia bacterium]
MAGPPKLFFFLFFYERYKRKFFERQDPLSTKKPLPFIIWFFRFLGKIFLFIIILESIMAIIRLIMGE